MSIEKLGSKMNTLSEYETDVIITNSDNGTLHHYELMYTIATAVIGTIPAHVSSLLKGKGKIIVLGATPASIRTIETNLSAISVKSIQLL